MSMKLFATCIAPIVERAFLPTPLPFFHILSNPTPCFFCCLAFLAERYHNLVNVLFSLNLDSHLPK